MDTKSPIKILIVDDHAMLRKGLSFFLMSYSDLKLVGEAANGKEALLLCASKRPDVVLMDVMMPIMDGILATRLIHSDFPEIKVIALTSFGEERLIKEVIEAGAISYLLKKASADELAKAIRASVDGIATYAPEVTEILMQSLHKPKFMFEALSPRELEVLGLIVKGMANNDIATTLNITVSTTKSHVSSVLAKMDVASRTEAIVMVLQRNLNLGSFYIP